MASFFEIFFSASIRIGICALAIWGALAIAKVRSSSLRHLAWMVVLFAMPLMPILMNIAPHLDLPKIPTSAISKAPQNIPMNSGRLETTSVPKLSSQDVQDSDNAEHLTAPAASVVRPLRIQMLDWPTIILFGYILGVAILLWRCWSGLMVMRRIVKSSRRILIRGIEILIYESERVAAPVTFGFKTRLILLPAEWDTWSADKLRGVLAHESEHVKRGDTIVNLIACLNRCFFWFHPLAWWLERQLALTAEQACDDAGVRALGENRKYAKILIDMAETVRLRGALFSFDGVSVAGTGLLSSRIDRLLREHPFSTISKSRKAFVALSCAGVILLAAACHRRDIYTGELRPDPKVSLALQKQKDAVAMQAMSARQAASLELALAKNSEVLELRKKLMTFYQTGGSKTLGDKEAADRFWKHKLWFIKYHPENEAASFIQPFWNQSAYEEAKNLWLAIAEQRDASPLRSIMPQDFLRMKILGEQNNSISASKLPPLRKAGPCGLAGSTAKSLQKAWMRFMSARFVKNWMNPKILLCWQLQDTI